MKGMKKDSVMRNNYWLTDRSIFVYNDIDMYIYTHTYSFVTRSNVKKTPEIGNNFQRIYFPYSNWSVFMNYTKFKLPIILCHFFFSFFFTPIEWIYAFDEGEKEKEKMCVKCQLSALFLLLAVAICRCKWKKSHLSQ